MLFLFGKDGEDMLNDAKKEKYCQARAGGKSQRQAYIEAYPASKRWKPETIDNKAYVLNKDGEIQARLKELVAENGRRAGLSRKNLLDKLERIINTDDVQFRGNDVIKAIELYVHLCGYDEVKNENEQQREAHEALIKAIKRSSNAD